MEIFYLVIFFIFGLVFGSFYNVVSFRLAKEESIINPPSHCQNCKTRLKALDLIPVLSYIFLKGKCRYCKEKISIFYPVIELFTGILFATSYYSFGLTLEVLLPISLSSLLVIVIVTDLNYYIIPDEISYVFPFIFFIINLITYGLNHALIYLVYGIIMFITMYLLMLLGNFIAKEESLGGGDIKLMASLGMTLSIFMSYISIAFAAILALPLSIYYYFKHKDKAIPFGPFLVAASLILLLLKIDINEIFNFFLIK